MSLPGRSTARLVRCVEIRRRYGAEPMHLARGAQVLPAALDAGHGRATIVEPTRAQGIGPREHPGPAHLMAAHRRRVAGAK